MHRAAPQAPRMPVGFVGHGAPTLALDPGKGEKLRAWARSMPRPSSILAISAHWEAGGVSLGATETRPLVYDFSGFPEALYRLTYPAPGAPELAQRVESLLAPRLALTRVPDRGLDHGVWVPLLHLFPEADVPVLQLSLPWRFSPRELFDLGGALAPLRDEGVLILGSGSLTHNLRNLAEDGSAPFSWAIAFDTWIAETLDRWDIDALIDYRARAPSMRLAHPSEEHLLPLLIVAGAAGEQRPVVRYPVVGFEYGALSQRCVQLS